MTITRVEYSAFQEAFDFFNVTLFDGKLPPCLITLPRRPRSLGYYSPERFSNRHAEATTDEIALNPEGFRGRDDEDNLSTLVHEMVHQYQFEFGHPGRGRYHNREWAQMMIERGLMPSDTERPGGKQTGQSMSHYVIEGGRFQLACRRLLDSGFKLNWESADPRASGLGIAKIGKTDKATESKTKYTCPECGQNAWAKPSAKLLCGVCYDEGKIVSMQPSHANGGHAVPLELLSLQWILHILWPNSRESSERAALRLN